MPACELSASNWFDAVHEEDRARILDAISAKRATGELDEEYRIIRPDGAIRWVHGRVFPVRNEASEIYHSAGIAEDAITDRKRLEQEIIEIGDRDLSRLGQDLHDGICQQLVSIAFASDLLRRDLVAKLPSEAVRVAGITALLDNAPSPRPATFPIRFAPSIWPATVWASPCANSP